MPREIGWFTNPMSKRSLIACVTFLAAGAVFAQAYKWVDEDGVVHYSDHPREGAETVVLPTHRPPTPALSATRPVVLPSRRSASEPPAEESAPFKYEELTIASPAAEETLWNIEGVLNVSLNLQPALQPGHRVRVHFDGNPQMVNGTSFQLQEVWRGTHNLQAEVLDEKGKLMIRSQPNLFYVQQNAIGL